MKSVIVASFVLAIAAFSAPANALPSLPSLPGIETSQAMPVANGCGRGRHWSWRLRRCVWNG